MRHAGRPFLSRAVAAVVIGVAAAAALTVSVRSALAEETPVPAGAENIVGELTRTWGDQAATDEGTTPLSWVRTESGDTVRVPTSDVSDIDVGSTVEVALGAEVADEATAEQGVVPAREVLNASVVEEPAAAAPPVTNEVTVVRVIPAGGRADTATIEDLVGQLNGPVHDYWAEQTNGGIELSATGWPTWVTVPAGCGDPYGILDQAAAAVGFVAAPGQHLLVYLESYVAELTACGTGFAEQGMDPFAGGMAYVKGSGTPSLAHVLGHNFGLGDSTILKCWTPSYAPSFEDGDCYPASDPVTDFYDVMGGNPSQVGSLDAAQAAILGFVDSASQQSVLAGQRSDSSYELLPLGGRTGLRTVEIAVPAADEMYWLEYRTATGQDAWLGDSRNYYNLGTGVFLRRQGPDGEFTSLLLDGTPSTSGGVGDLQVALPVGKVFDVAGGRADGGFTVTVESVSSAGASVRVASGAPATTNSLPTANWERLSTGPWRSGITVSGWAFDADDPTYPVKTHVYVDGRLTVVTANESRPDVGGAFPGVGNSHGFSASMSVDPGSHRVCVYAIDSYVSSANSALGCRTITSQMAMPVGNWEGMSASGSTVSVFGWTLDPDDMPQPGTVSVLVDGYEFLHTANVSRPDVGAAFPDAGNGHGFSGSMTVWPGDHRVCVQAIDGDLPARRTDLGCRSISTQMALPLANWEVLSADAGAVTVAGWALDTDSPSDAVPVHVYVDGQGTALTANGNRPDVGAVFAGAGSAHGFSWTGSVAPGVHQVCAYAIDVQFSYRNSALGCRSITTQLALPAANWEVMTASGAEVTVAGWAVDTDAPGRAVPVHVYVDGRGTPLTTNGSRPDVGAVFAGAGNSHGFNWTSTLSPGRHSVCVYAIDADLPWRNSALGCRTIDTQFTAPRANWEVLSVSGSTLTVRGWALDPDSGTSASQVHVYVDGQGTAVTANGSRPDVGAVFPGAGNNHGFSHSATVTSGSHQVCVYAIDAQISWLNTPLGCRTVTS
jgi:hypothetical protein